MSRLRIAILTLGTAGLLISSVGVRGQVPAIVNARCLHDGDESQTNRLRREQALSLARAINAAQDLAFGQMRRYQPLSQLRNLPVTPEGFVVRLYTDGDAYMFSIKDNRDACRYGIFSDQQGFLYQSSPTVPLIAT